MSHRKTDLGIPHRSKSAKVVLGRLLISDVQFCGRTHHFRDSMALGDVAFGAVNPLRARRDIQHASRR